MSDPSRLPSHATYVAIAASALPLLVAVPLPLGAQAPAIVDTVHMSGLGFRPSLGRLLVEANQPPVARFAFAPWITREIRPLAVSDSTWWMGIASAHSGYAGGTSACAYRAPWSSTLVDGAIHLQRWSPHPPGMRVWEAIELAGAVPAGGPQAPEDTFGRARTANATPVEADTCTPSSTVTAAYRTATQDLRMLPASAVWVLSESATSPSGAYRYVGVHEAVGPPPRGSRDSTLHAMVCFGDATASRKACLDVVKGPPRAFRVTERIEPTVAALHGDAWWVFGLRVIQPEDPLPATGTPAEFVVPAFLGRVPVAALAPVVTAAPVSVRSLRFYSGEYHGAERPFAARFRADSVAAVGVVLELTHGIPEPREATVSCEFVDPTGRPMETYPSWLADRRATLVMPIRIPAAQGASSHTGHVGWTRPGFWRAGVYRVACDVEGSATEGTFEIVAAPGAAPPSRPTSAGAADATLPGRLRAALTRPFDEAFLSGSIYSVSDPGGDYRRECEENWATSTLDPIGTPPPFARYDLLDEYEALEMWAAGVEWACQYHPPSAWDGDTRTAWVEGVDGDGIGEIVVVRGIDPTIAAEIWAGYGKSPELHGANSRPREIRLYVLEVNQVYEDEIPLGHSIAYGNVRVAWVSSLTLADLNGYQSLGDGPLCRSCDPEKLHFLAIEIRSVYPGSRWEDTCITEVRNLPR